MGWVCDWKGGEMKMRTENDETSRKTLSQIGG
jgi:hypothetical protein